MPSLNFREFDVYYLGESFAGYLRVPSAHYIKDIKRKNTPELYKNKRNEVDIQYTDIRGKSLGIGIANRPIDHPEAQNPPIENETGREKIDLNGKIAILITEKLPANFIKAFGVERAYTLILSMGGTSVQIYGGNRDEILQAAISLIKIN